MQLTVKLYYLIMVWFQQNPPFSTALLKLIGIIKFLEIFFYGSFLFYTLTTLLLSPLVMNPGADAGICKESRNSLIFYTHITY